MSKLEYIELKVGTVFTKNEDPSPYKVLEYAFIRMQQRKPVVQLKIKNLLTGKNLNYTAHQNENFEAAEIEMAGAVFIYENKGSYWFHEAGNPKNRFSLSEDTVGDIKKFLKQNTPAKAFKYGDKIINIELPIKMEFKVAEAPPAVKGNTAQGGTKQVTLETGAVINVPLFINPDDVIRVNTETGEYVERAEKN
ncbi:MAG: Elongation factor P [Candidatus Jorgensenbacteria bacterium GW2011_GWA2_45_9]|uniref:Elongation factor P n=1 Tax=Candidatus Jorgensenbacteria bacterium GW2011_GWA2_45_9 TaxID=1618663 RepID=A0A0G1QDF2_9BACT|nr:MAG: Elongation factor P [Candidatus Jorgensenbacteria bacterium GW2011_GWA2_45_9]